MTNIASRLIALVVVAACARAATTPQPSPASLSRQGTLSAPAPTPPQAQSTGALAALASQPLIVLPVQTLRLGVAEWSPKVGDQRAYLVTVDDEIAFAVRERRLRGKWAYPADLARAAKRNPVYATDPYTIALEPLAPVEKDAQKFIGEPLAGQLRAMAALFDARYALVPVDVRITPQGTGGRATLHLVVVDVRQARLMWKGDVVGDSARDFSPAIAADLGGRVADLFTTPSR